MSKPVHVLICDDSLAVHETISAYLKAEGMSHSSAYSGAEALMKFQELRPDLILLDVMMPEGFGTDICREIRKSSQVPIIMLTARGEEMDRILGLEFGADDYIVKPFSPREVITRMKTILRRLRPYEPASEPKRVFIHANLRIDLDGYELSVNGDVIPATPKEIEILYLLATHSGKVISREHILSAVWGYDYLGDTRAVDTHIKRLRKKLSEEEYNWGIKAVYGVGYKFEVSL